MAVMGALGVAVCLLCLPCVWAQLGGTDFLHIDCGAPAEYTDEHGITWRTDDAYVSTGAVGLTTSTAVWRELLNCRYFQNSRGKNCYSLPTMPEQTYMLRAEFNYGNYDGAGAAEPPYLSFRMAIDSTIVENVTINRGLHFNHIRELTFKALRNETSLCLLRDQTNSTPFISSIALRLVDTLPSYMNEDWVPPTSDRDWSGIAFVKTDMGLTSWRGDPCLPVPHDWLTCFSVDELSEASVLEILLSGYNLTGAISPAFAGLLSVTSLKLDNNSLSGPIPDLRTLKNLKTLHLQNNKLTGPLPSWLASLPLQELFVQNNDLSGEVPGEFLTKNWNFILSGNPKMGTAGVSSKNSLFSLSNTVFVSKAGTGKKKKKKTNIGALIGEILAAIVVFGAIVGIIAYCCCCRRRRAPKDLENVQMANPSAKPKPDLAAY